MVSLTLAEDQGLWSLSLSIFAHLVAKEPLICLKKLLPRLLILMPGRLKYPLKGMFYVSFLTFHQFEYFYCFLNLMFDVLLDFFYAGCKSWIWFQMEKVVVAVDVLLWVSICCDFMFYSHWIMLITCMLVIGGLLLQKGEYIYICLNAFDFLLDLQNIIIVCAFKKLKKKVI